MACGMGLQKLDLHTGAGSFHLCGVLYQCIFVSQLSSFSREQGCENLQEPVIR